jgi:hypothetical protein
MVPRSHLDQGIAMQGLGFFTQFILFYVLLVVGTTIVASMTYGLGTVNGQMTVLFVLVAGVPGVYKIVAGNR